jgi:hypothetical protein
MNIKDLNLPSPHVYAISDSEVYLLDDYTVDTIIGRITVKRGFIFDGASIPKFAWSILGENTLCQIFKGK